MTEPGHVENGVINTIVTNKQAKRLKTGERSSQAVANLPDKITFNSNTAPIRTSKRMTPKTGNRFGKWRK
jgi:hypothetical protein